MPIDGAGTILLCVSECLNGFLVKLLIDSGASECFVDTTITEKNGLTLIHTKEKVKIHLVDGTVCVSSWIVKTGLYHYGRSC